MDDKPKRPRGRPRTRPPELVRLRLDVTPDELSLIREASDRTGESVAAFARRAVVAAARPRKRKDVP